jgi:hypothetical protein
METVLIAPAKYIFLFIPTVVFSILIPLLGVAMFTYIIAIRMAPLVKAAPDNRFDRIPQRIYHVLKIWLGQYRQPRYMVAGVVHIMIFAGFLILSIRSCSLVIIGISDSFVMPGFGGLLGDVYNFIKDYAATVVLIACAIAAYRRAVVKPARYAVPAKYGKDHTAEALFVLGLISTLMISESLFEASSVAANTQAGLHAEFLAPASLAWFVQIQPCCPHRTETLQAIHIVSYYIHDLTFFFFLCFLPLGKHFHVITSLFNVFFMRMRPWQHQTGGERHQRMNNWTTWNPFGVKQLEDFTWKHILDFYSCADCGRCSDNCPANAVGRPLSPRFISIKGRDLTFAKYPLWG